MQLAQEVQVVKRETEKNQTSAIFPAPAHSAEKIGQMSYKWMETIQNRTLLMTKSHRI